MKEVLALRLPGETDDDLLFKAGLGHWRAWRALGKSLESIEYAAEEWRQEANGVQKPWLIWCAHPDWALIQQRLVLSIGWTPIVGNDPRVSEVPLESKSVYIDFNKRLNLPVLYPHFPLEFIFLWIEKIAFWHSDLLVRLPILLDIADKFDLTPDGVTWATRPATSLNSRLLARVKRSFGGQDTRRFWELIGYTTSGASHDQFKKGAGWWYSFCHHFNCPSDDERRLRAKFYWDHGTGIWFWNKYLGGNVKIIEEEYVNEGHFTSIGKSNFIRSAPASMGSRRNLKQELDRNYDLNSALKKLDLMDLIA